MSHTVRRYVFVYYLIDEKDKMVRKCYDVESNRFGKAFHSFAYFFNGLNPSNSFKDYCRSYYICELCPTEGPIKFPSFSGTDFRPDYCRQLPSRYLGYLFRSVPEV